MRFAELFVLGALLLTNTQGSVLGEESAIPAKNAGTGQTVVHLSHFGDNMHATIMALELGRAVQKRKATVVLFLDQEGVRLADKRQTQDLRWGNSEPLSTYFNAFVKEHGKIIVCPHCAAAAGLDGSILRDSAKLPQRMR
jgi:predicted peroxiredoxin